MDHKITIAWFIDCSGLQDYQTTAKCKQLIDYTNKAKFFNRFNVMVIPSKENKFQLLEEAIDLPTDRKELENLLESIKNKFKECITVHL